MFVWWTNQAACIGNLRRGRFTVTPSNSCTELYKTILFVGRFPIDYVQWIQFGGRDLLLILAAPGSGYVTVGGRSDGHVQPGWLLELLGVLDAAVAVVAVRSEHSHVPKGQQFLPGPRLVISKCQELVTCTCTCSMKMQCEQGCRLKQVFPKIPRKQSAH